MSIQEIDLTSENKFHASFFGVDQTASATKKDVMADGGLNEFLFESSIGDIGDSATDLFSVVRPSGVKNLLTDNKLISKVKADGSTVSAEVGKLVDLAPSDVKSLGDLFNPDEGFTFDELVAEDDAVVTEEGVSVLIDSMSYAYLVGARIDYQENLEGSKFVVDNPNAETTCGCGSSFSI